MNISIKLLFTISSIIFFFFIFQQHVLANETAVTDTGNGANSQNEFSVSLSPTVSVQQNNTSSVGNTIDVSISTGNNTANNNVNGATTIVSGDAKAAVSLTNTANTTVNQQCCTANPSTTATITNNGSNSQNTVTVSNSPSTTVTQNQTATTTDIIHISAETGQNTASNNSGGSAIHTGDATVQINNHNAVNNQITSSTASTPPSTTNTSSNQSQPATYVFQAQNIQSFLTLPKSIHGTKQTSPMLIQNSNTAELFPNTQEAMPGVMLPIMHHQSGHRRSSLPFSSGTTIPVSSLIMPGLKEFKTSVKSEMHGKNYILIAASILPKAANNRFVLAMVCNIVMMFSLSYVRLRSGRSPGSG